MIKHEKNNDNSKPGLENLQGPGFRSVQILRCPDGFVKKIHLYILRYIFNYIFLFMKPEQVDPELKRPEKQKNQF